MIFDMHVLESYIEQKQIPNGDEWFYQYTNGYCACADNRQEVTHALCDTMTKAILQFPYFNQTCMEQVFKDEIPLLHNVIVMPILASSTSFDCDVIYHEGSYYLLIDILNIANYTKQLNEMQYILQNQISLQLIRHMIHLRYPKENGFMKTLENSFFCDGLAQYLAWNENCNAYPFHEPSYQKKKENANTLLHKFYFSEDSQLQDKIIKLLNNVEFWNQFPMIYGMFFFHRIYLEKQEKGLCEVYAQGPHILEKLLLQDSNL